MSRQLTEKAEYERAQFWAEGYPNCSCFIAPPCGSCTHPGNPLNQEEDPECWKPAINNIHLSLAAYPWYTALQAMTRATQEKVSEPLFGRLSLDHVQICPQNSGVITPEVIQELLIQFPQTQFRLHANARVMQKRQVIELDRFDRDAPYWRCLRATSLALRAPAYTAHAGLQANATLVEVLDNTKRAEDFMGIPVGIEGHYPTPRSIFLLDSWLAYAVLLKSGVKYALDMSHIQILAKQSGNHRSSLIQELLASECCIEVHVSDNDGRRDSHKLLEVEPWWWSLLQHAHSNAIIFSEGTQP